MADLSNRAVLITLGISQWTARKYDKRVTQEVADTHGVQSDAGRYNKVLIESAEIKKVGKAVNAARTYFYANTLPWSDEYRIRPTQGYLDFMNGLGDCKAEFETRVREFCGMYSDLQTKARITLKGMYNPGDYPTPEQLSKKFDFSVSVMPLVGAQDFRIDLSKEQVEQMGAQLERQNAKAVKAAMRTAWTRLYEAVSHMADKLSGKKTVFRNSLVDNLEELTKVLPVLNITNDPELAKVCDEINHTLCSYDPDILRKDDTARWKTGRSAKKISKVIEKVLEQKDDEPEVDIFDSVINM
jgi:ribosomal protein L22